MLVAIGHFSTNPELASDLLADLIEGKKHVSAEAGASFYHFAMDDAERGRILVSECWCDRAALDRHLSTPHMKAFLAKWHGRIAVDVVFYDATNPHRLEE